MYNQMYNQNKRNQRQIRVLFELAKSKLEVVSFRPLERNGKRKSRQGSTSLGSIPQQRQEQKEVLTCTRYRLETWKVSKRQVTADLYLYSSVLERSKRLWTRALLNHVSNSSLSSSDNPSMSQERKTRCRSSEWPQCRSLEWAPFLVCS